jgi:hypothetical protein
MMIAAAAPDQLETGIPPSAQGAGISLDEVLDRFRPSGPADEQGEPR